MERHPDKDPGRGARFPYGEPIGDRRGLDDPDSLARPVGLEEPDRDAGPRGPDGLAKSLAACEVCGDGRRERTTRPVEFLVMAEPPEPQRPATAEEDVDEGPGPLAALDAER